MANPISRLNQARAAVRPEMKGRVMLSGPPGAGKTFTALTIATALVGPDGKILGLDSEKESMLTYADVFDFFHLRWNPPFDATALALTLKDAQAEYDCVIIDSFSHWWRKQGGILDVAGDNIRGWNVARPMQEDLIEVLLDVDMHVIVCCRSKMDHLIEQQGGGKVKVTKLGLKAQQDDDLEYEVNVALEVDMAHVLSVSKSRTNEVPVGAQFLAGYAGDFAMQYRDWLLSGEPVAEKEDTDALAEGLNRIADEVERKRAKYQFLDTFGRPEFLLISRLPEAQAWVADRLLGVALPVGRAEDEVPPEGPDGGVGGSPAAPASSSGGSGGKGHQVGDSAQAQPGSDAGGVASLTPGNSGAAPSTPAQVPGGVPGPTDRDPEAAGTSPEGNAAAPPPTGGTGTAAGGGASTGAASPGTLPSGGAVVNSRTGAITETVDLPPCETDADPGGVPPDEPDRLADDAVETIKREVDGMTVEQVRAALTAAAQGSSGAPATIRKRLIAHRIAASVTA